MKTVIVKIRRLRVGGLVALGAMACAMMVPGIPAPVFGEGLPPWLVCFNNAQAVALATPLPDPPDGATVPAGTPVTFSGESGHALTFSVASSPALLSTPDIDSGPGALQQGTSLYTFTSTKATATPRTIYWAASFTFTPEGCASPDTVTTRIRTLTVLPPSPTETEAAAEMVQEEEAAAKKKQEEAAAVVAPIGSVSLVGSTIAVRRGGDALLELTCTSTRTCAGRVTLSARDRTKKGKKGKTETIGTAGFSLAGDQTKTVEVNLKAAGRALLSADHGHCRASLALLELAPSPENTQVKTVRLVRQRPRAP